LEALARAGAGLAHQLRTPLATIKGSCQLLAEDETDDRRIRRVTAAIAEAERMERLLKLLLDYARPPAPEPTDVSLEDVLKDLSGRFARLEWSAPPNLTLRVDREHLHLILENLIDNADRAGNHESAIQLSARSVGADAVIEVADRGPGPGPSPEGLFEPYVTTAADGTGLGLPIARNLVEANRGTLQLLDREGGGTIARLTLPSAGETP
jgi:two-component system sensor histidine kinase PilS (NtrC family)